MKLILTVNFPTLAMRAKIFKKSGDEWIAKFIQNNGETYYLWNIEGNVDTCHTEGSAMRHPFETYGDALQAIERRSIIEAEKQALRFRTDMVRPYFEWHKHNNEDDDDEDTSGNCAVLELVPGKWYVIDHAAKKFMMKNGVLTDIFTCIINAAFNNYADAKTMADLKNKTDRLMDIW